MIFTCNIKSHSLSLLFFMTQTCTRIYDVSEKKVLVVAISMHKHIYYLFVFIYINPFFSPLKISGIFQVLLLMKIFRGTRWICFSFEKAFNIKGFCSDQFKPNTPLMQGQINMARRDGTDQSSSKLFSGFILVVFWLALSWKKITFFF